jgi:hypothetical protein
MGQGRRRGGGWLLVFTGCSAVLGGGASFLAGALLGGFCDDMPMEFSSVSCGAGVAKWISLCFCR